MPRGHTWIAAAHDVILARGDALCPSIEAIRRLGERSPLHEGALGLATGLASSGRPGPVASPGPAVGDPAPAFLQIRGHGR